jgi:hypothetical protein
MLYTPGEYKKLLGMLKQGAVWYYLSCYIKDRVPEKKFIKEFRNFLFPETYQSLYGKITRIPLLINSTHRTCKIVCRWRLSIGH